MDSCSPGRVDSRETISPASMRSLNFVHWSRFQVPATVASVCYRILATVGIRSQTKSESRKKRGFDGKPIFGRPSRKSVGRVALDASLLAQDGEVARRKS